MSDQILQKRSVFPAEIEVQIRAAMKQIRSWDKDSQPCDCFICGQYKVVAELHHVVPVRELAEKIVIDRQQLKTVAYVWLCPNHHRLVHLFERLERLPTDKKYNYVWYECIGGQERGAFDLLFDLVDAERTKLDASKQVVT